MSAEGEMTIVSIWLAVCADALASVTFTVTVELPARVGVPLTTQPDKESPAGRVPVIEQAYGVVPPAAAMEALYATPTVPFGRTLVMLRGEMMVMATAALAVEPTLSFTCTVKFEVPCAVGVPEITPVAGEMESPAGSEPAVMLHEYGVTPPAATSDVL